MCHLSIEMKSRHHHKRGSCPALYEERTISRPMHCLLSLYHLHIQIDFGKERCLLFSYSSLADKKHPEPICRDIGTGLLIWLKVHWKIIPGQRRCDRKQLLKEKYCQNLSNVLFHIE